MSVLLRIGNHKAILCQGVWTCADSRTEQLLNAETEAWIRATGGPPLSDEDPERTTAQTVAAKLGGKIVAHLRSSGKEARRIYFGRRQLTLDY